MDLVKDFGLYLWLVFSHWQAYVTGGGVTALLFVIERFYRKISNRAFAWIIFGGFIAGASFSTWRDAYSSMKGREADLHNTEIRLSEVVKEHQTKTPVNVTVQPAPVVIKSDPAKRGLTNDEKVRFQSAISRVSPGHIENFYYLLGDMDAKTVRDDTFQILKQHQWTVPDEPGALDGDDFYGVRLYLNYADVIPAYYTNLRSAYESVWPVEAHEYKHPEYKLGEANLQVQVGHRTP